MYVKSFLHRVPYDVLYITSNAHRREKVLGTSRYGCVKCVWHLMRIFLIVLSSVYSYKLILNNLTSKNIISSKVCNSLGIINFVSSQVSVTILVAISCFCLYGVVKPFRPVSLTLPKLLVASAWIT